MLVPQTRAPIKGGRWKQWTIWPTADHHYQAGVKWPWDIFSRFSALETVSVRKSNVDCVATSKCARNEPPPKQAVKTQIPSLCSLRLNTHVDNLCKKGRRESLVRVDHIEIPDGDAKKIWSWSDSGGHLSKFSHLQKPNSLTFQWLYTKGDASALICILFTTFYCQFRNRQRKAVVVSFRPSSVFKI